MGVIKLSEVRPAPSEVVALYDKYRQQIAQVRDGASAKQLKDALKADCQTVARCVPSCEECVNEMYQYLMGGKQIGRAEGATIETKKAKQAKQEILKHSKDFSGTLNDIDCMKLTGLSRNTFYKYKKQLKENM